MKAGRELDALVAEKIMGLPRALVDAMALGPMEYSTEIAAAWEVLDKLPRTMWPEVGRLNTGTWYCEICRGSEDVREITPSIRVVDSTAPHVICLAALLAIGVPVTL
jgi:hypothetical protein